MICKKCGTEYSNDYRKDKRWIKDNPSKFCSRKCANSRIQTKEVNEVRRKKAILYQSLLPFDHPYKKLKRKRIEKICPYCKEKFKTEVKQKKDGNFTKGRIYCSIKCKNRVIGRLGGLKSANVQKRRSKNEIYFFKLCKNYFNNVSHNENIFNCWDADIIIYDIKYAILWNGVWHYIKCSKKHSVKQVQNRDKIKTKEIRKYNYMPYIIKDMGCYNKEFVENEFNKFLDLI